MRKKVLRVCSACHVCEHSAHSCRALDRAQAALWRWLGPSTCTTSRGPRHRLSDHRERATDFLTSRQQSICCHPQAVLGRRLVVPEVYDIMGRVQALLVRAHAPPIRALASSVSFLPSPP